MQIVCMFTEAYLITDRIFCLLVLISSLTTHKHHFTCTILQHWNPTLAQIQLNVWNVFKDNCYPTKNKHNLDEINSNDSVLCEHTLHLPIMLCSCCLFHMPATHPHPIMPYQLSGMLGLTRKNFLVFLTTSKTGPNPYPHPPPYHIVFSKHKSCFHIKKGSI